MGYHHVTLGIDHGIHFKCGYTQVKGVQKCGDTVFGQQAACAAVALQVETRQVDVRISAHWYQNP
jgi:hypothetical protein